MPDALGHPMPELSDLEVRGRAAAMQLDAILDQLIEGFEHLRAKDRAEGATDDEPTLGGLLMVIAEGVPSKQVQPLLALAIRRLAEVPDASS